LEKQSLMTGDIFRTEIRIFNPDDTIRWVLLISSPRKVKNTTVFDGIEIDISAQKNYEHDLIRARRNAEESDKLKSVFLQNISHEIRTPMNGILGFLDLLSDETASNDEKFRYLDVIRQNGNRLMETIEDIVDASMIESDQLELNPSTIHLNIFFETQCLFLRRLCESKKIVYYCHPADGVSDYTFITDSGKLDKALKKLLSNAVKFTRNGRIDFGVQLSGNEILFFVKDTGAGISEERMNAIFDWFVHADMSIARGHEGLGLGLTICKAYVELLGGRIWVESKPGEGSSFFLGIPV
jgi:signal transduction histidine kinase